MHDVSALRLNVMRAMHSDVWASYIEMPGDKWLGRSASPDA
jgi:hypothetical protein